MQRMRDPGIEPGSVPWQGTILPLNQPRFRFIGKYTLSSVLNLVQSCSAGANLSERSILCVLTCYEEGNHFEMMLCQTGHAVLNGEISAVYASY